MRIGIISAFDQDPLDEEDLNPTDPNTSKHPNWRKRREQAAKERREQDSQIKQQANRERHQHRN